MLSLGILMPGLLSAAAPGAGAAGAAAQADQDLLLYTLAGPNGHTSAVNSVAFSSDGSQVVTGSDDRTAKIWNVADGTLAHTLAGHTGGLNSVAFRPDGSQVADCYTHMTQQKSHQE